MSTWAHKDEWKRTGSGFAVVVSRHSVNVEEPACFDSEGPNRWCIYGYVYPKHPLFAAFNPDGGMWDQPTPEMHGGCSFFRAHRDDKDAIVSFQFGCDYNHNGDWRYTQMAAIEDAAEIMDDGNRIFEWLELRARASA